MAGSFLDAIDAQKPKRSPRPATGRILKSDDPYVTAAIKDELSTLATTGSGQRNHQLNISALKLGRLPVDRDALRDQLIDACEANGLVGDDGADSVERTIDSAFSKADIDGPRAVPERPSDGSTRQTISTRQTVSAGQVANLTGLTVSDGGTDDGAELLDELLATLKKYVVFPSDHAASAVALWIAATHALPAFECAPRLVATSPDKRCGKSRLLDIVTATCHKSLATVNASTAAVFRSIGGDHPPTLVIDEADTIFGSKRVAEQNEDLRALLNAGHQRGRPALRCVGPDQTPTPFPTFAMAAVAGIGKMPDTITDRAVNITMRRRAHDESVSTFRSRRDGPALVVMRDRLANWASDHLEALADSTPAMPVEDRAADTWEPLIAVADHAGGHWPDTARKACTSLVSQSAETDEEQSVNVMLLADIRRVYEHRGMPFLPSMDVVSELRKFEESPWNDYDLNPRKLAMRLSDFGIKPQRATTGSVRGYALEKFSDAFGRYLRQEPSDPSETAPEQGKPSDGLKSSDGLNRQNAQTHATEVA